MNEDESLLEMWERHSMKDRVSLIENTNHVHLFKSNVKTKPQDNIERYNNALKNLNGNPVFIELLEYGGFKVFYNILCSGSDKKH